MLITRRLITKSGTTAHLPRFVRRFLHREATATESSDEERPSDGGGVHSDGRVLTYVVEDSVIDPRTHTATFTTRNVCSSNRILHVLETCTFVPNTDQPVSNSNLPRTPAPTPVRQHPIYHPYRWGGWLKRLWPSPSRGALSKPIATAQSSEPFQTATATRLGTLCVKQVEVSSPLRGVSRIAEQFGMQRYRSNQANASRGLLLALERLFPAPSTSSSTISSSTSTPTAAASPSSTASSSSSNSSSSSLVLDVERQLCARFGLTPAQLPHRFLPHERLAHYRALLRRVLPTLAPPSINA